jgi:hypothetical protein
MCSYPQMPCLDRLAIVGGVRRVRTSQPVHRRGWVDAGARGGDLDDVINRPFGQLAPASMVIYRSQVCP